ncbi:MAG TPA: dipeptide/oligopeptide/nickel ABC transporter ATP-binding protein, partial [Firmicutes bacterium]|nr:dipeptide/oligopeptide/nickel ABC transporter ATP-binding protein [Bacillota bacterium]
ADEPTTALDVTIQAQILQMMNDLKKKFNTSMILITHDLGVVAQTCDKVAIMYAGRIVESGTTKDIYEEISHHPYTIGLFNSIPIMDKDAARLSPIPGLMPDPMIKRAGCSFSERCPHCMERCKIEQPGDYTRDSHMISCFLFENSWGKNKEGQKEA